MPKIAFVGAGSAVFTRNLVGEVLSHPELRDEATFALMDIDADRLRTAEIVTQRLAEAADEGVDRDQELGLREALPQSELDVSRGHRLAASGRPLRLAATISA